MSEIWYKVSGYGRDYRDPLPPEKLPAPRTRGALIAPIRPIKVHKSTTAKLKLYGDGGYVHKVSHGRRYVSTLGEALHVAREAIEAYLEDYARRMKTDHAEDLYVAARSGDHNRQAVIVRYIDNKVEEERARFKGWQASAGKFCERVVEQWGDHE